MFQNEDHLNSRPFNGFFSMLDWWPLSTANADGISHIDDNIDDTTPSEGKHNKRSNNTKQELV